MFRPALAGQKRSMCVWNGPGRSRSPHRFRPALAREKRSKSVWSGPDTSKRMSTQMYAKLHCRYTGTRKSYLQHHPNALGCRVPLAADYYRRRGPGEPPPPTSWRDVGTSPFPLGEGLAQPGEQPPRRHTSYSTDAQFQGLWYRTLHLWRVPPS